MNCFKTYIVAGLLSTISLVGCSFQGTEEAGPTAAPATWAMTPVQVVSSDAVSDPVWGMPVERAYHLKACVKDTVTPQPRVGEVIRFTGKSTFERTLDAEGCFYWSENVAFRFLADETFGEAEWTVELAGEKHPLRLAFNPWKDGAAGLADLTHTQPSELKRLALAAASDSAFRSVPTDRPNLLVQSAETPAFLAPKETAVQPMSVRLAVASERQTFEGPKQSPLTKGDLRFRAWLVASNAAGEETVFAALAKPARGVLRQGWLEVTAEFSVTDPTERATEKILYFELVPADQSAGLRPVAGRISLTGSAKSIEIIDDKKLSAVKATVAALGAAPPAAAAAPQPLSFLSYGVKPEAAGFTHANWQTTRSLLFTVCLEANLELFTGSPDQLDRHPFEARWIRPGETREFQRTSNKKGCLSWRQKIEYPFAVAETYWPGAIQVRSQKAPFETFHAQVAYDINPWREEQVGWDTQEFGAPDKNEDPRAPELVLASYTASQIGTWDYRVDEYMQLTMVRRFHFQLVPKLNRPWSFDKGASYKQSIPENLDMNVAVEFARADGKPLSEGLEKEVADPAFLASFQTRSKESSSDTLEVEGAVPIQFVHLNHWAARVRALFNVSASYALHPPRSLNSGGLFVGAPIRGDQQTNILFEKQEAVDGMVAVGTDIPKTVTRARVEYPHGDAFYVSHTWTEKPLKMYREYLERYAPLDYFEVKGDLLTPEQIKRAQAISIALGACPSSTGLTGKSKEWALECANNPLKYFHVAAVRIADKVNPKATGETVDHGTTSVNSTFFNERKFSLTEIRGHTSRLAFQVGAVVQWGFNMMGFGGTPFGSFTAENTHYNTEEGSFSQDWRNGMRGQSAKILDRKKFKVRIHGDFHNCIVIRPLPMAISLWNKKVLLRCTAPKAWSPLESYISLMDQGVNGSNPSVDAGDVYLRGWQKLIRGEDMFEQFDKLLSDATRGFVLKKIESFHDGIETTLAGAMQDPLSRNRLFQDGGVFPGVVDYVEHSDIRWSDYEIRRKAEDYIRSLMVDDKGKPANVRPEVAARTGYCYAAELATMVDHREFKANKESVLHWEQELNKTDINDRCEKFALDPRWDKPAAKDAKLPTVGDAT